MDGVNGVGGQPPTAPASQTDASAEQQAQFEAEVEEAVLKLVGTELVADFFATQSVIDETLKDANSSG